MSSGTFIKILDMKLTVPANLFILCIYILGQYNPSEAVPELTQFSKILVRQPLRRKRGVESNARMQTVCLQPLRSKLFCQCPRKQDVSCLALPIRLPLLVDL